MRNVKIICTIGPASSSKKMIERLIRAGMDVARLNFSHGTWDEHGRTVDLIREVSRKYDAPVAILQDLKGLKIRVGSLANGSVMLKKNARVALTARNVRGSSDVIPLSYRHFDKDVHPGDSILLDDGLLRLKVTGKSGGAVAARVVEGGVLKEKKGVNLPGTDISGEVFTAKDRRDLEFGIKAGVDCVAVSFVRSGRDIRQVRTWMRRHDAAIPVIAKIENRQALEHIDEIIAAADALMVARGDLGVELPPENVPLIQKDLIERSNAAMKPVITATQMLESMTGHMTPTRAEAADVANAVIDGTDALMLSAETSIGRYPVEAVKMMDRIITSTEVRAVRRADVHKNRENFAQALAEAACSSARDIGARTLVAFSRSGFTALLASKYRPGVPITAFTDSDEVRRRMSLFWGVTPYVMKFPDDTDRMIADSEKALLEKGIVNKGNPVVIIAASPFSLGGKTNVMKLHRIGY